MATYDLAYPGAAIDAILNTAYFLQEAGYIFQGSASEYSGTPSKRVWLIAPAGFTGFGITSPVPKGSIGICLYNGTAWAGKIINVVTIDSSVSGSSNNAVSSSAVYAAINQLATGVAEALDNLTFTDATPSSFLGDYINMKVSTTDGGIERILTFFTILAATTSKAGLLSAEDKVKIDSFLTGIRSMQFVDATTTSEQAIKLVEQLKWTVGGVQEVIDSITLLAATSSKAGLLSAADKAYIDALPATLTSLSNSISGALALMQSLVGYYVCDTAAGTAAKTVEATGYSLTNGGCIRIKMTNANTAANVTLNINSTGAKALYYDGAQASSTNTWEAGEVLEVYYDGTQYQANNAQGGIPLETINNVDFAIADENKNALVIFKNGHIKTKEFDSETTPIEGNKDYTDLDIVDENGNVIVKFKGGNIITKNFNSSRFNPDIIPIEASVSNKLADRQWVIEQGSSRKTIKILFLGNSLTQDAVSYLPLLLREITPELSFKLYDAYNAGITLLGQYNDYLLTDTPFTIFSVYDSDIDTSWNNYNSSKNIQWILNNCDFDIVVLQEYSYYAYSEANETTYYNNIVNFFESNYSKALKFATFIDAPNRSKVDAMFSLAQQYAGWHLKNTNCQSVVAPGAAVYYAMQTSLDELGDQGHLSPDGTHTQEGLPCLLQSYALAMWIYEQLGIAKSICGSKTRITQSVYDSINVPGPNLGSGVITGTDAQHSIAQECAVKASKLAKKIEFNILSNF